MKISAVIPVRAGSTRVKDKNIRRFAESSLLEIKIQQLMRITEIDEIIVSSDSEDMLSLAHSLGVKTKKRPIEYCDEKTKSFNEVVEYIAKEEVTGDIMMWVPCVCPLLKDESIQNGIKLYQAIENGTADGDSVVSALLLKDYIFDEHGPVNFSVEHHVPSQRLPEWHIIKNGFFIARRENMIKWKFVYGPTPLLKEIDKKEALDIDDEFDFKIAEYMYMHGGNVI